MIDPHLVELSRLQFALTALYHFLFVPLTLGLSILIAMMETVYVMTQRAVWRDMKQTPYTRPVTVAVLDTGVRYDHPDLKRLPADQLLERLIDADGGPLISPRISEAEQAAVDATCRKLYQFLTHSTHKFR